MFCPGCRQQWNFDDGISGRRKRASAGGMRCPTCSTLLTGDRMRIEFPLHEYASRQFMETITVKDILRGRRDEPYYGSMDDRDLAEDGYGAAGRGLAWLRGGSRLASVDRFSILVIVISVTLSLLVMAYCGLADHIGGPGPKITVANASNVLTAPAQGRLSAGSLPQNLTPR